MAGRPDRSTGSRSPAGTGRASSPVADADRATLIRRVTFDLTGLPPTPEEIDAFVADKSAERLRHGRRSAAGLAAVRRALGPALARRGPLRRVDRQGSQPCPIRYAWRYRDYVIDAFNDDKPYDRFIVEQLAGDLLPRQGRRRARPAAHRHRLSGHRPQGHQRQAIAEQFRMDLVDEQIDVTSRAFLGLTVACARCHDHKFDPIPTGGLLRAGRHLSQHADLLRHRAGQEDGQRSTGC